jgi:NAD+ synthase (glutamine-hydrolysing)
MDTKVKFALAQLEVTPGRPDLNFEKIIREIQSAKKRNIDVIVFSEMVVFGYLQGDKWEYDNIIRDLLKYNEKIREASEGITVIWGNIFAEFDKKNEDGRTRKYNAAFVAQNGNWVSNGVFEGHTYKTLMPEYREFDDPRHFYSMLKLANEQKTSLPELLRPFPIKVGGKTVNMGVILCEDMWCDDYVDNPTHILVDNGAEVIVNISCSPWTWRKNDKRHRVVKSLLEKKPVPFVYCNNTGIQNNGKNIFLFDGNSTVYNSDGTLMATAKDYQEETLDVIVDGNIHELKREPDRPDRDVQELYDGLVYGIRLFMKAIGKKTAVSGTSGGIDSAVVTCLFAEAIGPENVYCVNMPSKYNSDLTKNAAYQLSKNLKTNYLVYPIQDAVDLTVNGLNKAHFVRLDNSGLKTPLSISDLVVENIQARDRSSRVLAGIAAGLNSVFTNNGNKTETMVGYCTLYGDVDGVIAAIADLYKFEVYQLADYINKRAGWMVIPEESIKVVPSAELGVNQDVTKGKGDPIIYPYHDKLFRAMMEFRFDPEKILDLYISGELEKTLMLSEGMVEKYFPTAKAFIDDLERWWKLYELSVFKRVQAPPIIAVSRRAFGFDHRESQLESTPYFTQRYLELKEKLLNN